jgi:hypothetical protein
MSFFSRRIRGPHRFLQFSTLGAALMVSSGCSTVSDLITSNLPDSHAGRPSIVVSLRAQEAYLYRGGHRTASSRISSGREGYRTPVGHFQVIRKDEDHRSSLYGDYVDDSGRIVKANVNSSRDPKPPHSHFVGAPMLTFSNSRRATDCTRVTCRGCPHHMDALGCLIGKRASFITPLTSGPRWLSTHRHVSQCERLARAQAGVAPCD